MLSSDLRSKRELFINRRRHIGRRCPSDTRRRLSAGGSGGGGLEDPRRRPLLDRQKEERVGHRRDDCGRSEFGAAQRRGTAQAQSAIERSIAIVVKPTLRQAWLRDDPEPQYAFKISMFNESCNSH